VAATLGGARHVIFVTRYSVVSVNPDDGSVRLRFPFGKRGPTVNAATPLVFDDRLFVAASYGVGAVLSTIGRSSADTVWSGDDILSSQYSTSIYHEGFLYGVDGRADVGAADLRAIDAKTGKIAWSQKDFGVANLLWADGKLLISKDVGTLVLAKVSPDGYRPLASAKVLESTTRALPALSSGLLYLRDASVLKCLEVGQPAKPGVRKD
jgi:outer membrane protein assembly factor BamB